MHYAEEIWKEVKIGLSGWRHVVDEVEDEYGEFCRDKLASMTYFYFDEVGEIRTLLMRIYRRMGLYLLVRAKTQKALAKVYTEDVHDNIAYTDDQENLQMLSCAFPTLRNMCLHVRTVGDAASRTKENDLIRTLIEACQRATKIS